MNLRFFFTSLIICIFYFTSSAQEITGNLEGWIYDGENQPLPGVNVSAESPSLQGIRGSATDENGFFRILALPSGDYTVKISHISFQDVTYQDIPIRIGRTTTLQNTTMQDQEIEMEEVVISGEKPLIDVTSTDVGMNLTSREFENLPLDRNYRNIAALIPQANKSYYGDDVNIGGATGQENIYYIDGMHVTDPYKAVGGTNLPYNFIKEVQIKSGGYQAEFGRSMGGIVNVITHSGSNELSASAFGFFSNNRLESPANRGINEFLSGNFSKYDAGLTLGGPIIKDKLWYFVAYNQNIEKEDIYYDTTRTLEDRKLSNLFAAKIDWKVGQNTNLVFTALGDPTKWDRIGYNSAFPGFPDSLANLDPVQGKWKLGGVGFSTSAKHTIGDNFLFEVNFSQLNTVEEKKPATVRGYEEPILQDLFTGIWSGGYGDISDRKLYRTATSVSGTYFWSNHVIKLGMQYERTLMNEDWRWSTKVGDGGGIIARLDSALYITASLIDTAKITQKMPSWYVQGSFALLPGLRLNAGLRWEKQFFRAKADSSKINLGDEFQPRIGLVYSYGEDKINKISLSYGRFYQQMPMWATSSLAAFKYDFYGYPQNPTVDTTGAEPLFFQRPIPGKNAKAEYYDELTMGFEIQLSQKFKTSIKGIARDLKRGLHVLQDTIAIFTQETEPYNYERLANPGFGIYDFYPKPMRWYTALELTFQGQPTDKANFYLSYVLSRNYGNFIGLFNSDFEQDIPQGGQGWYTPEQLEKAEGLLPNDRTHVFKLFGTYRFTPNFNFGTSFTWQSGTPINEFGGHPNDPIDHVFMRKRGTAGRTPSIWDLNLRFSYQLQDLFNSKTKAKFVFDVIHAFSQRKAVTVDQDHYKSPSSDPTDPTTGALNTTYGLPTRYQPPMVLRFGMEVSF